MIKEEQIIMAKYKQGGVIIRVILKNKGKKKLGNQE